MKFLVKLSLLVVLSGSAMAHDNSHALLNKAQQALAKHLRAYGQVQLSPKTILRPNTNPISAYEIELPQTTHLSKRMCVRLHHEKQTIVVWFKVEIMQKVLVAKRRLKEHNSLKADDFTQALRDITGLKGQALQQLPAKSWLKKSINNQAILTSEFIESRPLVIKGRIAEVHLVGASLDITTEALAQNNGYLGEKIQLKNNQNNQLFEARVIAENQVEVRL